MEQIKAWVLKDSEDEKLIVDEKTGAVSKIYRTKDAEGEFLVLTTDIYYKEK